MPPSVIESVGALRQAVAARRAEGLTVALVPTMGALHEGHMALVRAARAHGGRSRALLTKRLLVGGRAPDCA